MPNNIDNVMTILGPADDIAAFIQKARGRRPEPLPTEQELACHERNHPGVPYPKFKEEVPLEFHCIVPLPEEYANRDYHCFGYEAERAAWGVKWGAYGQGPPVVEKDRATYTFTTAWDTPMVWVKKASIAFPGLVFAVSFGGEGPTRGRYMFYRGYQMEREWGESVDDEIKNELAASCLVYNPKANEEEERVWHDAYEDRTRKFIQEHGTWVDDLVTYKNFRL